MMTAFLITACGGGDGAGVATLGADEEGSPRPRASVDPEEAFLRFAQCMREHGVEVSDPQQSEEGGGVIEIGAGEDIDPHDLQEAHAACRHLMPRGTEEGPNLSPQERARIRDQMVRFAECMRDQGIDFPDPVERDGGIFFGPDADLSPDDPVVQEAQEACDRSLPGDITREER
jgi:hypothetical protein